MKVFNIHRESKKVLFGLFQWFDSPCFHGRDNFVLKNHGWNKLCKVRLIAAKSLVVLFLAAALLALSSCKDSSVRPAETMYATKSVLQSKTYKAVKSFSESALPFGPFGLVNATFGSSKEVVKGVLKDAGIRIRTGYNLWDIKKFSFFNVKKTHLQLVFEDGYGFRTIRLTSERFTNFADAVATANAYAEGFQKTIGKPTKSVSASLKVVQGNDYQLVRGWNDKKLEADVMIHELINGKFRVKASIQSQAGKAAFYENDRKKLAEIRADLRAQGGYESTSSLSCYEIGYRFGKCATLSLIGKSCDAQDDISVPVRCRNNAETKRGIADGTRSVSQ